MTSLVVVCDNWITFVKNNFIQTISLETHFVKLFGQFFGDSVELVSKYNLH